MSSSDEEDGGGSVARSHLRLILDQCSNLTKKALNAENPEDHAVEDAIEGGNVHCKANCECI